jgi:gamma-butyrobetaine dioxygenase
VLLRVHAAPSRLHIEWQDGTVSELTSIWLRDNCPEDRDARNGQRLVDIVDLPEDPRIRCAAVDGTTLQVGWEGESRTSSFDLAWLAVRQRSFQEERPELAVRLWDARAPDAAARFAWARLSDITAYRAARLSWLTRLLQEGIAFLRDVPCTDTGIFEGVTPLGRICETNYGQVFDVRSVPQPENLAYSDLGLGLHTDNPYREPVPGFQALHALVVSPEGGDSLFGDGFALARHLRTIDPGAFETLVRTPVPFLYRSKDTELFARRPLIQLSCDGEVTAVHYNSRSIAPLRLSPQEMELFYVAYRRFAALLREPSLQVTLRLAEGDMVVFDNQRILHGRTAFSSARHTRHLRGCYLTRDSVYATAAQLRWPPSMPSSP